MTSPCPVVPDVSELSRADLERVTDAPLRCAHCGGELELRCGEGHKHEPRLLPYPNSIAKKKDNSARQVCTCGHTRKQHDLGVVCLVGECECPGFEPKYERGPRRCVGCGAPFLKRQMRCLTCHPYVRPAPRSERIYSAKVCACGALFAPTSPNTKRCDKCRGAA